MSNFIWLDNLIVEFKMTLEGPVISRIISLNISIC